MDDGRRWIVDEVTLDALAVTPTWRVWSLDKTFGDGTNHPTAIYGPKNAPALFGAAFDSADDLKGRLLENMGGGVPIDVIDAVVHSAEVVDARVRAIIAVARARVEVAKSTRSGRASMKPLREAIWFWWNVPRFEGAPKVRSKYPLTVPWSSAAWDAVSTARGRGVSATSPAVTGAGLVLEHLMPLELSLNELLDVCDRSDEVRRVLRGIEFVVITAAEDRAITRAGFRNALPSGSVDPWDRYRFAAPPIDVSGFALPALPE